MTEKINPDRNKRKRENDRFIVNVTFDLASSIRSNQGEV